MDKNTKACGFTLAEVAISMLIMSVIVVITLPLMTGRKLAIGTDMLVQSCILNNNGSVSSPDCISAISNCKINNSNNSCNNLIYYSTKGTAIQKDSALKVLQEACNQGGVLACNYFINLCVTDNIMCNISSTTPVTGLRPFLLKNNFDNTFGKLLIEKTLKDYYVDNVANIFNEVNTDCPNSSAANTACNIRKFADNLPEPSCTSGSSPGTIMTDGSVKVGNYNGYSLCATPNDSGSNTWNNGYTGLLSTGSSEDEMNGLLNTNGLATSSGTETPYKAACICYNLVTLGHNDWYLPAINELSLMYTNSALIGNFNTSLSGIYWSSTEDYMTSGYAKSVSFKSGMVGSNTKYNSLYIRCIRRD